jgi:ribosome-associated toxin RatA of RatAB toxin-antitoxin module
MPVMAAMESSGVIGPRCLGKLTRLAVLGALLLPTGVNSVADAATRDGIQITQDPRIAVPNVKAAMTVPYPPDTVWALLSNPVMLTQLERRVRSLKLLSRQGNQQDLKYTVSISPLLPNFDYVLRYQTLPPYQVQFRRVQGSFKSFDGGWLITPLNGGKQCRLSYTLRLDPGFMAPRVLVTQALNHDLPSMMGNVRRSLDRIAHERLLVSKPASSTGPR